METYLVGGAVRDELLGLDVREKDWVVVGASEKDLLNKNFKSWKRFSCIYTSSNKRAICSQD